MDKLGISNQETDFVKNIIPQLDEYFSGKRKDFDIEISPKETNFQKQVWHELQKIPYGEIKSYSDIAKAIGNKNAQRAVGLACNKNPIIIIIPLPQSYFKKRKYWRFCVRKTNQTKIAYNRTFCLKTIY